VTTFEDCSSVNYQIENVYVQAASLFDTGETVDLSNEYHRGVVELVTRLLGIDSDDKEDVAHLISERLVTPRQRLDQRINRLFPSHQQVFYIEGNNDLAAVEDYDGNMWRVWADGDAEKYTR
jgi:hypothetical protein